MSTGIPQPLQRYNAPISTTALTDSSAPYSFTDWYNSHQFITIGQEYQLYNIYLTNWFKNNAAQTNNTSTQLQLNYLALLRQLQVFFSQEETQNWYNNVDITNTKEILLAIPYFAKKLKEISYIHAEAYPAGELKHGPLALIDADMPVITVAPNNKLLDKLKSNIQEVSARGGQLIVFMDETLVTTEDENVHIIKVPQIDNEVSPIIYTIPLQLLSYYVAILKGTDVDQPRNLAKSVTVE